MPRPSHREQILEVAQAAVLAKGFEATSIDEIVAACDITRGGFFYHFADKNALAIALIERHIIEEDAMLDDLMRRADELTDDPLQSALITLKFLAELLESMEDLHPGCVVASAAYQDRLFDRQVRSANRRAVIGWRKRWRAMFDRIAGTYPPNSTVDFDALADFVSSTVEGGLVIERALGERGTTSGQVMVLRDYVKLLFTPKRQS